jgi:hypothetical protein
MTSLRSAESPKLIARVKRARVASLQNMMNSRLDEVEDEGRQTQATIIKILRCKVLKKFLTFSRFN